MIEKIEAFAADIDMTLTAKGGDLPELTKKAFDVLHANGVKLGLATGRERRVCLCVGIPCGQEKGSGTAEGKRGEVHYFDSPFGDVAYLLHYR